MDENSFDQLAEQAASGLKADGEIYLEVKQELRSHLEEKAAHFEAEGYTSEESVELSKKAFGSPLDVAAELLDANRRRMKLRSLMRIAFGVLIVPLAVLLALYLGYGRVAHTERMVYAGSVGEELTPRLPALPFYSAIRNSNRSMALVRQLAGGSENAGSIRRYWAAHRDDPDSYIYYAYHSIFLNKSNTDEHTFVEAMRLGEKVEPQNALYNVLLAEHFLEKGMEFKGKGSYIASGKILNRHYFELGIGELRKAAGKPYLRTYGMTILQKRLNSLPRPIFVEDYMAFMEISSQESFPYEIRYLNLAEETLGCVGILLSEDRIAEAGEIIDIWKPLSRLFVNERDGAHIDSLLAIDCGQLLSKQASAVYIRLGEYDKARDAGAIFKKLSGVRRSWRNAESEKESEALEKNIRQHASLLVQTAFLYPRAVFSEEELTPGRMVDHVISEEALVDILISVLTLALLGTLLQGAIWHYRLRRTASTPLLLMPPAKEILRALLLGIALPMAVYWVYSRLPVIGGREFGWASEMKTRFIAELCVLGIIMFWLPAHIIRGYIRRRCEVLGIELPGRKREFVSGWKVRGSVTAMLGFLYMALFKPEYMPPVLGTVLAIAFLVLIYRYIRGEHGRYGLYYGTLAKSLAPVYAAAVIFISLTVQPWLLYNEANWLSHDKIVYGYLANPHRVGMFTAAEERSAQKLNGLIRDALETK